jgi:hypothetical protein
MIKILYCLIKRIEENCARVDYKQDADEFNF